MSATTTLYAKLAEVTAEVGYVAKDGHNDFQNYDYTSAEAVLAALRGPLSARKVVLMPSVTALSEREYTTTKGKASVITTVHVSFTFVDGESGERHECSWAGQGDDPGDKGLGKAYTSAVKTFLRGQFLIPQGNDPEADSGADERSRERSASATSRPVSQEALPAEVVHMLLGEIKQARMPMDWLRMQLAAVGLQNVPDGPLLRSTLEALSGQQADALSVLCRDVVEAREHAEREQAAREWNDAVKA